MSTRVTKTGGAACAMGGDWWSQVGKRVGSHPVATATAATSVATFLWGATRRKLTVGKVAMAMGGMTTAIAVLFIAENGLMRIRLAMISMLVLVAGATVGRFVADRNDILQASPSVVPVLLGTVALGTLNWQLIYLTALLHVSAGTNGFLKEVFAHLRSGDNRIQKGNPFNVARPNPLGTGRRAHTFGTHIPDGAHAAQHVPGCGAFYKGKASDSSGMPSGHSQFAGTLAVFVGILLFNGGWVQRRDADATAKMLGFSGVPDGVATAGRAASVAVLAAFVAAVMWHRWDTTHCHSFAQVVTGAALGAGVGTLGYVVQTRELTDHGRLLFRGPPSCKPSA